MKNIDLKSFSENTQRIYLDDKYPLIIRLDGVNVTKNNDKTKENGQRIHFVRRRILLILFNQREYMAACRE